MKNDLTACRGGMLQQYYHALYLEADRERTRRLAAVTTRVEAEAYRAEVRAKLRKSFGPMPDLKILSVQKTGEFRTPKLIIEKLVLEVLPGRFVPATFFYPEKAPRPLPGVLLLCGHDDDGKSAKEYQRVGQSFALRGFGVLCPDPFGQGERREFGGCPPVEHNIIGTRSGLLGEFFGTWRLFDALSALEYLKDRPDMDGARIGVTGCSGGGTLTSYVNAFSDIPCMAAPVCSITRMTRNLENEICTDNEQNPPDFKKLWLEEGDFFLASAPRPCYLGSQDNDFFDADGTRDIAGEMKRFYRCYGAEDKVVLGAGAGNHRYSEFHSEAIGKFFSELACSCAIGDDGDIAPLKEEDLLCVPGGDVRNIPGSRSVQGMLKDLMERNTPSGDMAALKAYLGLDAVGVPGFRRGFQQYLEDLQLHGSRFLLNTEPGIEIALKKIGKTVQNRLEFDSEITLLLPEITGVTEFPGTEDAWLLEVRGVGETLSCPPDADLMIIYPGLYSSCGLMTGRTMFSGQVRDILSCLEFLKAHQVRKVTLIAKNSMTHAALTAAVWSPLPLTIEMEKAPVSWRDYVSCPETVMPCASLPFGIMRFADIPQLMTAVKQAGHTVRCRE